MVHFNCDFISQEEIDAQAEYIYSTYWENDSMPIDIELIVEKIGLEIIPMDLPDNVDAYLKLDCTGIVVNETYFYNERSINRFRFSIAHELGHFILHREIIKNLHFNSIEEYYDFLDNIPRKTYSYFEYQANEFAGRLLVPIHKLKNSLNQIIESNSNEEFEQNFNLDSEQVLAGLNPYICEEFGVSEQVIDIRIKREGLLNSKVFIHKSNFEGEIYEAEIIPYSAER